MTKELRKNNSVPSTARNTKTIELTRRGHKEIFWCSVTEKHQSRPVRLPQTKIKSSPEALLEELLMSKIIDRL